MKLVVCGGREERLTAERALALRTIVTLVGATEIVVGGCRGIDSDVEVWAQDAALIVRVFLPDWDKHGPAAGPLRNNQMAAYADQCVAFPGGRGTEDMVRKMTEVGKRVWREP